MNAIIWWLESPWQLRAIVFTLSFFVCFVGPWLHNQSLLSGRIAARNPLEEKSETVPAPKAEVPHQDAEAQAKVPAPQEQATVQEKAALASAEEKGAAQHEQAPFEAAAPVHAMQVPAAAPVREEHASAPVSVAQAPASARRVQVPASAQVALSPIEARAPAGHEQVPTPAQAPAEIAPAPAMKQPAPAPAQVAGHPIEAKATAGHERVTAPAQAPVEIAPAFGKVKEPAPALAQIAPHPVEAKAPAEHEQVPALPQAPVEIAPALAMEEPAPAPTQVAPSPVEAKVPAEHEQVSAAAQAPVVAVPVPAMEERASAPTPATVEEAPVLSEPKAPARQEQAAVQAPAAPSAASKAQPAGGFKIISQSASVISFPAASPVEKQEFAAFSENGGSAEVEVYVLSNKAGRSLPQSNRVVDQSDGRAELSAVLDSDAFAKAAARYDTVACVGLVSRSRELSAQEITRLTQLCGIIARKPYVSTNTKLYGLPLGQQMESARPQKERAEKSLLIIGLRNTKGNLTDAAVQKKMISEIIRGGNIANFPLNNYSEVASGNELRYIEVKGRNNNRPIKSSAVKPAYALQREIQRLLSARHKRCGAGAASRPHLVQSEKVSPSHANAETSGRKAHSECSLFDFPF